MSPEPMDSQGRGEYDRPKRRRLSQRLGEFVARHLIQGDESVARSGHDEDLDEALAVALEAEYSDAIGRAQTFLAAVSEGRLPAYLVQEADLSDIDEEALRDAVFEWVSLVDSDTDDCGHIQVLRANTVECQVQGLAINVDDQVEYCAHLGRLERGLIWSLRDCFLDEGER